MSRKLKVFRTPIGFHDAYVAVPTKKAALEAWGSSANLFARGAAEEVTDPALTKAALAAPGEVVKVPRGTAAEHVAALGKAAAPKRRAERRPTGPATGHSRRGSGPSEAKPRQRREPAPKPRPSREKLDAAEVALAESEAGQRAATAEIARREKALADEREKLERAQAAERAKLEQARDAADVAYRRALEKWRG